MATATIDEVREWVRAARSITVLTGAGISTDSGIPDFRGPNGVWTKNPAAEKASNISYYLADPEVRKASWRRRLESTLLAEARPNVGHLALVELERRGQLNALITQNIDGLHHAAGHSPDKVIEIHGSAREVVCMECGERAPMERALERVRAGEDDPPCRSCGGILKSATISFGQSLVSRDIERAEQAAATCDLLLAIGSTLTVVPAAYAVPIAAQNGARIAIVNAEETAYDHVADAVLRGPIAEIVPAIVG
ncbi:MAG TPA: Sir2 family NAD-dependent protein deacetylase [Acidimicrobiales bacterium]|nr:Sir2 family NAD-dependent protein deacetylase [Acidimicrobiales bacterium]